MMNRILMLSASLAVAAFVGTAVAADKPANNTHTGVVVSAVDGKLTMMGKDKKEHAQGSQGRDDHLRRQGLQAGRPEKGSEGYCYRREARR